MINPIVSKWLGTRMDAIKLLFPPENVKEIVDAAQAAKNIEDLPYFPIIRVAYDAYRKSYQKESKQEPPA